MFLSSGSIRRPVAMSCLIIALSLLGLRSYQGMGVEWLPKVDFPIISIVTVYPGGSPREIETDVAKRIEEPVLAAEFHRFAGHRDFGQPTAHIGDFVR